VNEIVSIGSCAVVQVSAKDYLVQVDERQLAGTHSDRFVTGSGRVLGRLDGTTLTKAFPVAFAGEPFRIAAEQETGLIGSPESTSALLQIGTLDGTSSSAFLIAKGLSRHTFLCGQSGSGKTYSLGALLEQVLIETTLPMVLVDPNSDHVHLGTISDHGRVIVAGRGAKADVPLRIHLSDLTLEEQALTLGLDPVLDAAEYGAFADAVARLDKFRYGMADVDREVRADHSDAAERLALRISNLAVSRWSVWATAEETSLVDLTDDWRVLVLDVGSLDEVRERALVSLALLGVLRRRPNKRSVLIVMDEAHNVCPPEATTPLGRVVTDYTVWIAGEGRKYGIHLLLATQRPQKIHPNVLSQCDNLLLMRVNSSEDIDRLVTTFSHVPEGMIREASGFQLGEMLAAGPLAPVPLRLRTGRRLTPEGGADLPTTWATPNGKAKP
jgi:DNA helicase HerA-like ATPase